MTRWTGGDAITVEEVDAGREGGHTALTKEAHTDTGLWLLQSTLQTALRTKAQLPQLLVARHVGRPNVGPLLIGRGGPRR